MAASLAWPACFSFHVYTLLHVPTHAMRLCSARFSYFRYSMSSATNGQIPLRPYVPFFNSPFHVIIQEMMYFPFILTPEEKFWRPRVQFRGVAEGVLVRSNLVKAGGRSQRSDSAERRFQKYRTYCRKEALATNSRLHGSLKVAFRNLLYTLRHLTSFHPWRFPCSCPVVSCPVCVNFISLALHS
jgi:hypothetical protein